MSDQTAIRLGLTRGAARSTGSEVDKFKQGFFNRAEVMKEIRGTALRALGSVAAYIRTVARNSMKKGKFKQGRNAKGRFMKKGPEASKPGQPPRRWDEKLRDYLYFAYDRSSDSILIGPAQLGRSLVPLELEEGDPEKGIEPRPYMKPAFEKAKARLSKALLAEAASARKQVSSRW